jgi:hypothetical protein
MKRVSRLLIIIYFFAVTLAWAEDHVAVSLLKLQKAAASNSSLGDSIPISHVIGVLVDKSGDIRLIGKKGENSPITLDDIALALRGAFSLSQPPGVITIRDFVPGSSGTRLIYSGGIANTTVGAYMAKSVENLYALSQGKSPTPKGFWSYPPVPKIKLRINAAHNACIAASNTLAFILEKPGILLQPENGTNINMDFRVTEWLRQVQERHEEIERLYPALHKLRNFLDLYQLFSLIKSKTRKSIWHYFLEEYQPTYTHTPKSFDFNNANNIVSGISPKTEQCSVNWRLNQLRNQIISLSADAEKLYFEFPLKFKHHKDKDQKAQIVKKLKEVGLNGLLLNLKTLKTPPVLKFFHDTQFYTQQTSVARKLKGLITQTVKKGNITRGWAKFYAAYLSSLVTAKDYKPALVLVADKVGQNWINLDKVDALMAHFDLFIVSQQNQAFSAAVLNFLDKVGRVPLIADSYNHIGIIVSTSDKALIKEIKSIKGVHILINPTKSQFRKWIINPAIKVLLLDVPFGKGYLKLRDGNLNYKDILKLKRLDHIKYLALGLLNRHDRVWDERVLKALQTKGVGIFSITRTEGTRRRLLESVQEIKNLLQEESIAFYQTILRLPQLIKAKAIFWEKMP